MHRHSLIEALALAESLSDDGPQYQMVRELRVQLRSLLKDAENAVTA